MTDIKTCAESLLDTNTCCWEYCDRQPMVAVLDDLFVEHLRCEHHTGDAVAVKQYRLNPIWGGS